MLLDCEWEIEGFKGLFELSDRDNVLGRVQRIIMRVEAVEECDLPFAEYVNNLANQSLLPSLLHGILVPLLLLPLLPLPPFELSLHLAHLIIKLLSLLKLPALIILLLSQVLDYWVEGALEVKELNQIELGIDRLLLGVAGVKALRALDSIDCYKI